MELNDVVTCEWKCIDCKHFEGTTENDGFICPHCGKFVLGSYNCYNSGYRVKVKVFDVEDQEIVVNSPKAEVVVVGDKIVVMEVKPIFAFQPRDEHE